MIDPILQLRILDAYQAGMTPTEIAKRHNCSRFEVCRITGHVHADMTEEAAQDWKDRITGGVVGID